MKLPASITITRPSCSDGRKCISISVVDQVSGCEVLDAEIPYEDFVEGLMSGTGYMEADWRIGNLGRKREVKEEIVSFSSEWIDREKSANAAVSVLEIDGWKARTSDVHTTTIGKHTTTIMG